MTPESAVAEGFARLMERKRGGRWLPVERDHRDVATARAREARRSLPTPEDFDAAADRVGALAGAEANRGTERYKQGRREEAQRRRARKLGQELRGPTTEAAFAIGTDGAHVGDIETDHVSLTHEWLAVIRQDPCSYSREPLPTEHVDHIVPVCDGGMHGWTNLTSASARENQCKSSKPLLIYLLDKSTTEGAAC